MFYPTYRIRLLLFMGGLLTEVQHVIGIEIYTPSEIEAVNGTDVKLKCTFSSTHPVTLQSAVVSWNFRAINSKAEDSVFFYHEDPYPPTGQFKDHVQWTGDILKRDASITLLGVQPTFNGTYLCQVRNRPDVHGPSGEIVLRVVEKVTLSEIAILAAAIGGACAVFLILLGIIVAVRLYRRKHMDNDIELHPKDPTVW